MKLALILCAAFLSSGCAVKSGGAALLPSRTEVVFQHCLVTARDDDGKALSCRCPKLTWATDAKTGKAVALCTE
jgi:hypothetical protein